MVPSGKGVKDQKGKKMIKKFITGKFPWFAIWLFSLALTVGYPQAIGTSAPPFSGTTIDGKVVQLSDYKGSVVLLDIWASWCGPCRQEMPYLIETDKQYRDQGLVILAVNIDKEKQNVDKFISSLEVAPTFPVILDPEARIPQLFQIKGMPTTVLIDRSGVVRYQHVGFKSDEKDVYLQEINTLLKEKSEP
jgi:thiol-disulfide isomerase/thioredoxin